jgi:valyl-tRNA synthetase
MISSPAGNDLLYDEALLEQGRNFSNKMWNALKLIKMWEGRVETTAHETQGIASLQETFATNWMRERINEARQQIDNLFKDFKLSEALKTIYSLIWDDFCSWYLEWVKPALNEPMNKEVYEQTVSLFEDLLQLLHPFMPFLTEEVFHILREQKEDLIIRQLPVVHSKHDGILQQGQLLQQLITSIRDTRNKNLLKPKDVISLSFDSANDSFYQATSGILQRQVNADKLEKTTEPIAGSMAIVVQTEKIYILSHAEVNTAVQKDKMQEELNYLKGFLVSVDKKLSNEKFVQNAKPEILANERKKQSDAEAKIRTLEESLSLL